MKKTIRTTFISLFCVATVFFLGVAAQETVASNTQEITCVVGDANYDESFDLDDLIRLKKHLNATTELDCSLDGDLNVSGELDSVDVVRCREMLAKDDKSLQVTVTEDGWYKQLKDADGYYAYYKLNKAVKEGWTLTFAIDYGENTDCEVYAYYSGCKNWVQLGNQVDGNQYRIVAEEEMPYLNIRVANADNTIKVSDFRVYDIQVLKSAQGGEVNDLAITYNQTTQMPVVYGINDTLDMTKFGVQTSTKDLSYTWSIKQTGVENTTVSVDMASTAYEFNSTGNYTLTATVNTEGYSGSVSTKIMVVKPEVYIGFDNGTVSNAGDATNTVGAYSIDGSSFTSYSGTVNYATDINGKSEEAIITNHKTGPYTVVKDYEFGTDDFTVSAWINVSNATTLSSGSETYLFGTMQPNGTDGFALCLKSGELRVKVLNNTANMPAISFERDSWYNVTVKREGTAFKVYFDGEMIKEYAISDTDTFGTKDLAFGAYHGVTWSYKDENMRYDDIQVYGSAVSDATIRILSDVDTVGPDVFINYNEGDNEGEFENTGMQQSIKASAYALSSTSGTDTTFVKYTDAISYGTGVQGENNGSLLTNHKTGPYTVTSKYPFNTEDFTVSTWFKIPAGENMSKSGTYIFGTANPDASAGFSVCIKYENEQYQVRLKHGSTSVFSEAIDFKFGEWYHITLCRDTNALRLYLNGDILQMTVNKELSNEVPTTADFTEEFLAVGGCNGWKNAYQDADMYFDDVKIYGSAVATKYIKEAYNGVDIEPMVHVDYTDSTVTNTGANSGIAVGTYKMNATKGATMFVTESAVPYTMGVAYDKCGAISTNHFNGTYTVVRDYVFGTKNFTISVWVKVPEDSNVSTGAGTYLFGNDNADTQTGFAVSMKESALRIKLAGNTITSDTISYQKGRWYNVALVREGASVKAYFDGKLVKNISDKITSDYDFGTGDLSFGGYYGVSWEHQKGNTHFDEIKIYDGVLLAEEIEALASTTLESGELTFVDESTTISSNDLFYKNERTIDGSDPGCVYVTEGEYAGWYIAYIGFNSSTQVKCYKSQDLVSWTTADNPNNRCFSPITDSSWMSGDIWAPEVYYDATDKTYYMFYSATNKNDTDGYKCLGLATSKSPIGPFTDIGSPVFDGATLASKNSYYTKAGFIDASPFVDPETGNKYLYMTRNRDAHNSNIVSVVKMNDWRTPDYATYQELTTVDKTEYIGTINTERVETGTDGSINEASQMTYYKGTYYLTMSVRGTTESEYSVIQALGQSPMGPFTKVQESDGGVVLGVDLNEEYRWDHISCCGSHSFVNVGDEWFILYHTHKNLEEKGYDRSLAVDRMVWTTNSKGQTIMKAVGPTASVQPKPASYSGYINIAPKATVTATNAASDSSVNYLNDGVVRMLSDDCVKQFEGNGEVTITMKFDQFVKAKSLLIYNSWKYADAFEKVSSVTFKYGKVVDGVRRIGTKTITDVNFDMATYSYTNSDGKKVMIPGSPMVLTFDETEIIEVSIVIPCPDGKSSVAVSEVMLLGKALEDEADVHVSYKNGAVSYTSLNDAVTVGAKILSVNGDKTATFNDYTGAFTFATGVDGDANGAIMTNHTYGPLTVVEGYDFGSNDFTVSTWFKVPSGETIQSSGNFIFGISDPDNHTSSGFSACIKYSDSDGYQWRFKDASSKGGQLVDIENFTFDTWYHIAVTREGSALKWYVDGELLYTQTAADFTSTKLAVGAFAGWGGQYKNTDMYFDELKIYGSALSGEKIAALTAEYKN